MKRSLEGSTAAIVMTVLDLPAAGHCDLLMVQDSESIVICRVLLLVFARARLFSLVEIWIQVFAPADSGMHIELANLPSFERNAMEVADV